ncbi:hypothetical protein, partial [Enterobacter asburiae]
HGDVLMWLMKTLLTSGCTNQRGAGHCDDGFPGVTEKRPGFEWALLFAKLLCENTDLWVQRSSKSISSKSN